MEKSNQKCDQNFVHNDRRTNNTENKLKMLIPKEDKNFAQTNKQAETNRV